MTIVRAAPGPETESLRDVTPETLAPLLPLTVPVTAPTVAARGDDLVWRTVAETPLSSGG